MWQTLRQWFNSSSPIPEKWQGIAWKKVPFLAIDLELTSLDPKESEILSIGWVESKACQINLNSCYYKVISSKASLNQSPVIHGLVEQDIIQGEKVSGALKALLPYAESHIWVFHNTSLDMQVLQKAYAKLAVKLPQIMTMDTLVTALYLLRKQHQVIPPNAATLSACRQRYNLPFAPAHNALDDAMATLELLHALLYQLDPKGQENIDHLTACGGLKCVAQSP